MIVAKYKFDSSVYSNLIPVFNDGYNGYTVSDEIDSENSNHIIRTIECDTLPTKMRFGDSNGTSFKPQRDSLLELIYLNTINIVDMIDMFAQCSNLISVNTEGWNTSNVTSMYTMFYDCKNLTSLDVSNFNTSKVVTMNRMFFNCSKLTSLDVSNWDTSNVKNMSWMFSGCNKLTSLDVSNWDTSNVKNMSWMFSGCNSLTSLDVSNWDTSKVTDMSYMFRDCNNLTSLDVSNWDTSKVTNMNFMFYGCERLTTLDVSNFDTSNVTNMGDMFNFCYLLKNVDVSNWDTSNVQYVNGMFARCRQMTTIDISNFDMSAINISNKNNYYHMFISIPNVKTLIFGNNKFPDDVNFIELFGLNIEGVHLSSLEKVIVLEENTINKLTDILPDRSSELNPGVIVTNATISDEAMNTISDKNWSIRKMIAQYRFDANTYENLLPEFNTEFSSDKYEVNDSVSEIVIDNILCERGVLTDSLGTNATYNEEYHSKTYRTKNYIPVIGNTTYHFSGWCHLYWYDANKKMIGEKIYFAGEASHLAPANAKYLRFYRGSGGYTNYTGPFILNDMSITAKLITRSIESVNGDLPTQMYFGNLNATTSYYTGGFWSSLLRVYEITTSSLTTMRGLFRWCDRLTNIDGMSTWDTSNVVDMGYLFDCCKSITSLDVSNWNTSNVTTMNHMFNTNSQALTSLDLSNFNTSNVTSMGSMFANCYALTSLDVSNFNTSNVTSMSSMFNNCKSLTTLDISNFNTSNVTSMTSMFRDCSSLTSLDVSSFNTNNVTDMTSMFNGCKLLTSLNVSNFNTSKVTNMAYMFKDCNNLTSLDVSNFNTSKVTNMQSMFNSCTSLTSLNVSNFNTSKVTNIAGIFYNCINLTSLDVSNWDTSNVTIMNSMFWKCAKLKLLILSNWNFSKVINTNQIFSTNANIKMSLETLDVANWEVSDFTNTGQLFYTNDESLASIKNIRCNNANVINNILLPNLPTRSSDNKGQIITSAELTQEVIDALTSKNWTVVSDSTLTKVAEYVYDSNTWNSLIPTFNSEFVEYFIDDVKDENGLVTRVISSMGGLPTLMVFGVKYPNPIGLKEKSLYNVNYIDVSNLTNTAEMFRYCTNLISINTTNWDTSKVTNMSNMFFQCDDLTELDVSNFNTSKVTAMGYMFHSCTKLTSLDLSNWNTSNVTVMGYMFNDCYNLTSLDLSNFDTSKVTNFTNIFNSTSKLSDIGMLYCSPSTINAIVSALPTTHTQTIWVKDTKPNECTVVSGVEFKEYKENGVVVNLNSPLLNGDRIEMYNGKLCHYHKMGMIVLDGSEDENYRFSTYLVGLENLYRIYYLNDSYDSVVNSILIKSNNFRTSNITNTAGQNYECIGQNETYNASIQFNISTSKLSTPDVDGFKQWLQANPTTVVYELVEPYYEDITPIQSKLTLETYLESNLDIYTKLPIKTNLTYLTNITNTSSIEEEINAINEGTDLTNLLEDEINN